VVAAGVGMSGGRTMMADLKGYLASVVADSDPCACDHVRWQHERRYTDDGRRRGHGACKRCDCARFVYTWPQKQENARVDAGR
jgi:hypothetical protein